MISLIYQANLENQDNLRPFFRMSQEKLMFTHVVMFKLADDADRDETVAKLQGMAGQVPSLRHIEVGQDVSRAGNAYDIVLITKFDDLAGKQAYDAHPQHVAVVEHMHQVATAAAVVDYEG